MKKRYLAISGLLFVSLFYSGCGGSVDPQVDGKKQKSDDVIKTSKQDLNTFRSEILSLVNYKKSDNGDQNGLLESEVNGFTKTLSNITFDFNAIKHDINKLSDMMHNISMESNNTQNGDYNLTRTSLNHYKYTIRPNYSGVIVTLGDKLSKFNGTLPSGKVDADIKSQEPLNLSLALEQDGTKLSIEELNSSKDGSSTKLNLLSVKGSSHGYAIGGNLSTSNYVQNDNLGFNKGKIPTHLLYTGNILDKNTSAELQGNIEVDFKNAQTYRKDEDPQLKIDLSGKLLLPDLPELNVNLGYDVDPTNVDRFHLLTLSILNNKKVDVTSSAVFDQRKQNGKIAVKFNDGLVVDMQVKDGNLLYGQYSTVKKDGKIIGVIVERQGVPVIKYIDGTIESIY